MKTQNIDWSYFFKHSTFTLLLAPIISQLFHYLYPNPHQIIGLLEVYPLTLFISLIFSSPTYIFYVFLYGILFQKQVSILYAKGILISTSIIGIFITMYIVMGNNWLYFAIAYSISSLLTGMIFNLNFEDPNYDNNTSHNKNKSI